MLADADAAALAFALALADASVRPGINLIFIDPQILVIEV